MQSGKKNHSDKSNSSKEFSLVRNPMHLWMVRILGFFVIIVTLDFSPNTDSSDFPHHIETWANTWIADNLLDVTPSDQTIIPTYYADLNTANYAKESSLTQAKTKSQQDENKVRFKNTVLTNHRTHSRLKPLVLSSKSTPYIIESEQREEVLFAKNTDYVNTVGEEPSNSDASFYENQLQAAYQASSELPMQKKSSSKSWVATGNIGPQYAQGTIGQPTGSSYASSTGIENMSSDAEGVSAQLSRNAFAAMLNLGIRLSSHLELVSGLNYAQMDGTHEAYYDSEVDQKQTILTSVATPDGKGTNSYETISEEVVYTNYFSDTLNSNYRVSSFEIPLVLKYNFGKSKLNYFISSGVSANIGSSYSANYKSDQTGVGQISESQYGMNAVNILFGFGIQYKATSNISIQLSPGYKYGIPVSKGAIFQSPVSSLGIFTGLSYYFE